MNKKRTVLYAGLIASMLLAAWLSTCLDEQTRTSCVACLSRSGPRVWSYAIMRDLAAVGIYSILTMLWWVIVQKWGPKR